MVQLAINEMTTYGWSFETDIQNYVKQGVHGIGVWRQKLTDYGEEKGVELLNESGLQASSLHWAGGFTGSELCSHAEAVNDAKEAIFLANDLGANCLVVHSGGRAGHTRKHARRLLHSALSTLVPIAEEHGVVLGIEPIHPDCVRDFTFLTKVDETLDILKRFDSSSLRMIFDAYHLGHDQTLFERHPEIVEYTALVQLGDARTTPSGEPHRCRLGEGSIPLADIVGSFLSGGYTGFFEVELMGEEIELMDEAEVLRHSVAAYDSILFPTDTLQTRSQQVGRSASK